MFLSIKICIGSFEVFVPFENVCDNIFITSKACPYGYITCFNVLFQAIIIYLFIV